jgi:hypothetical protein
MVDERDESATGGFVLEFKMRGTGVVINPPAAAEEDEG